MKIIIKRALIVILLVFYGITNSVASTYYAKIKAASTGNGKVYTASGISATVDVKSLSDDVWTENITGFATFSKSNDKNVPCYAYAKANSGYAFKGWSTSSGGSIEVLNNPQEFKINSDKTKENEAKDGGVKYAFFESVLYQYTSSYELPSTGGHFALISRGQNRFLQALPASVTTTIDTTDATVFYISNNSSSTLKYKNSSTIYYVGQQDGDYSSLGGDKGDPTSDANKTWTIEDQRSGQDGYYFKNKNTDDWRFLYGGGVGVWFPKGEGCVNYNRSWALVPVYLFHTTAPTVIGGSQTWSVANAKKIPMSSSEFSSQSTTASFAATPDPGYNFVGWWDNPEYTGDAIHANQSYTGETITNSNCADTLRYYAKFLPYFKFSAVGGKNVEAGGIVYAKINNGDYSAGSVTDSINGTTPAQADTSVTVTFAATPATDYNFAGWYDNAECTGTYISMSNPYTLPSAVSNNTPGSTVETTLYAKFVVEKVPTFTWSKSSIVAGRDYSSFFSSSNKSNAYTIESSDETIANVDENKLYAYKEGTVTFTVTQEAGNNWIEHTEEFIVIVNPVSDWAWIAEECVEGDFYIHKKNANSDHFINNNNKVSTASTLWNLTSSEGTWSIKDANDADKFLEVLCVNQASSASLSNFNIYSDGAANPNSNNQDLKFNKSSLTIGGSKEDGYSIFADDINYGNYDGLWGWTAQRWDVYVGESEKNLVPAENGNIWEFISPDQYNAYAAYQRVSDYNAITNNHLSASLHEEMEDAMEENGDESPIYISEDFSTCETNLNNVYSKCTTFVASKVEQAFRCDKSGNGYYMFYNASKDARLGDDVQAYTATWKNNSLDLKPVDNQVIPAGTVALVYSNSDSTFYYALEDAAASSIADNAFVLHDETYLTTHDDYFAHTDYILTAQKSGDEVNYYAFCKFVEDGISHDVLFGDSDKGNNQAKVLVWPHSNGVSAPAMFRIFTEENTATALVPVYEDSSTTNVDNGCRSIKVLIDGKLYIKQDDTLYDLLGRKVH